MTIDIFPLNGQFYDTHASLALICPMSAPGNTLECHERCKIGTRTGVFENSVVHPYFDVNFVLEPTHFFIG